MRYFYKNKKEREITFEEALKILHNNHRSENEAKKELKKEQTIKCIYGTVTITK